MVIMSKGGNVGKISKDATKPACMTTQKQAPLPDTLKVGEVLSRSNQRLHPWPKATPAEGFTLVEGTIIDHGQDLTAMLGEHEAHRQGGTLRRNACGDAHLLQQDPRSVSRPSSIESLSQIKALP